MKIFVYIFVIYVVSAAYLILIDNRNPSKTLSWLLIFTFLPVIGVLGYLFFGESAKNYRIKRTKLKVAKFLNANNFDGIINLQLLSQTQRTAMKDEMLFLGEENTLKREVMKINLNTSKTPIMFNNSVKIYKEGIEKYKDLFTDIKNAKQYIHMEYFIFKNSVLADELFELLKKKARQGVRIRILYDELGSFMFHMNKEYLKDLRAEGIEIRPYLKIRFPFIQRMFNYRNHRKIIVIDGLIGYIGGINVADEYVHKSEYYNYWRDTHTRITGDAVYQLQIIFLLDYYQNKGSILNESQLFPTNYELAKNEDQIIQIVSSGPDSTHESIYHGYVTAITRAKKFIYIQTPYFILDEGMLVALKNALLSGVDVKIMFPSFPDHRVVYLASMTYLREIVELGANVYFYKKGFLHAKTMIVDDTLATVGSSNMDIRSFMINFEVNAFLYSKESIEKMKELFMEDLKDCEKIDTKYFKQFTRIKSIKCSLARLLSPLM